MEVVDSVMIIVTIDRANNTIISLSDRNSTLGYSRRALNGLKGREFCNLLVPRDIQPYNGLDSEHTNLLTNTDKCERCRLDAHEYLIKNDRGGFVPVTLSACIIPKQDHLNSETMDAVGNCIQKQCHISQHYSSADTITTNIHSQINSEATANLTHSDEVVLALSEARDFDGFDGAFRGGQFDSKHVAVVQISNVGRIMTVPRGSCAVFGPSMRPCDLLSQSILRFISNDDIPLFLRKMRECASHGVSGFTIHIARDVTPGDDDDAEWTMEVFAQTGIDGRIFMLMVKAEDVADLADVENILHSMSSQRGGISKSAYFDSLSHSLLRLLMAAGGLGYDALNFVVQTLSYLNRTRQSVGAGVVSVIEGAINIYLQVGIKVTNTLLYPYVRFFGLINSGVRYAVGAADVSLLQVGSW